MQLACSTAALRGLIRIGSWKSCSVKPLECQKPLRAFGSHLPRKSCGVWQSLQVATAWWLDFCQLSRWSFMTWQLAQPRGSLLKYDPPSAYQNVKLPKPAAAPASRQGTSTTSFTP